MPTDTLVDDNVERRSLKEESWREACDERWYRSQEAGRDMGESAIRQWVHLHWPGFLRARWIEHMLGVRFWVELDRDEFGVLKKMPGDLRPILDDLIEQLRCGAENLNILCWSRRRPPDQQKAIRELLQLINVNAHRLRCHFSDD
jgi:hypothetical protein